MKVVVVSPHPDDETLGAGGTIARLKKENQGVYWINVTNVINSTAWDRGFIENRKKQIDRLKHYFAFDDYFDLSMEPCSLEMIDKSVLIQNISKCFDLIKPDWVILPNPEDAHSDHRIVYEACMACTKVFRYPFIKRIATMEILSETDFNKYGKAFSPNYFVDISDTIDSKIEALKIYDTELGVHPFPRSIESIRALATIRGAEAGCKAAEAFNIVKWID